MPRKFVCQICREKDLDEKMTIVKVGKQNKRYHTEICYEQYLKDQEFKKKEKEELDELVEVIKKVHGIETIPNQFFTHLQDIRNGNELFGKVGQKRSKQGYTYRVIARTYEENEDSINWARNNRDFKGTLNFLQYTKAIIKDKIAGVNYKIQSRESKKEIEKATIEQAKSVYEHVERQPSAYKKTKQQNNDASAFLD